MHKYCFHFIFVLTMSFFSAALSYMYLYIKIMAVNNKKN